jgi:hypothetical protein
MRHFYFLCLFAILVLSILCYLINHVPGAAGEAAQSWPGMKVMELFEGR